MILNIALDMDEVIVDLLGHWELIYKIKADIKDTKKIVVKEWNVASSFNKLPPKEIYSMLDIPGMFKHCSPIDESIFYINCLMDDSRFNVHIITVAKARTAFNEKLEWLHKHLGPRVSNRVMAISSHDFKAELSSNYDVLVEDNHKTLEKSNNCHRILYKHPHNSMAVHPRDFDDAVNNWEELYNKLEELWEKLYGKKS